MSQNLIPADSQLLSIASNPFQIDLNMLEFVSEVALRKL
jgi:hypothetical protein